jgi:MFS family permease
VAHDGYLPHAFAIPGRRLVYAVGILFLALGAGGLLVLFGGITDRLIPLFAVGAFLSFTLSQAGMAVHWRRHGRGGADALRLAVNGFGALATGAALAVILAAKFTEGAWLTLIVIPLTLGLLLVVHRYYRTLENEVLLGSRRRLDLADHGAPVVVIPVQRWSQVASRAVRLAVRLSPDVVALHLSDLEGPEADEHEARLRADWRRFVEQPAVAAGLPLPRLEVRPSPYRSLLAPLLRLIADLRQTCPGRPVVVALPELVEARWWEYALHTHRLRRLRGRLLRFCGPEVSVLVVPWHLAAPDPARVIAEEEPAPA